MKHKHIIELYLKAYCDAIEDDTYIFSPHMSGSNSFAIYFEDGVFKGVKTSEDLDAAPTILSNLKEVQDYVRANYV
jgi:hypothetical protein